MFPGPLGVSLAGRALEEGRWSLEMVDIRGFGDGKHRAVDDTPAGGGPGMVLRADVIGRAIDSVQQTGPLIYLTPRGKPLTQARVRGLSEGPGATLLCGHFEGLDERVIEGRGMEEISIGDYVLSGGEIAAMVLLDSVVRLLPGVMGDEASHQDESFETGLLEYPHYTRPRAWEGRVIPDILLSGDHGKIKDWRRRQAEEMTKQRRPDLWKTYRDR